MDQELEPSRDLSSYAVYFLFLVIAIVIIIAILAGDTDDFRDDVQVVPRLIGEWGDIVISLKDGTKVDLRSVPKFREIADYCLLMKEEESQKKGGRAGDRRGF
ncbi:uncharacterized protein A4U43_C07F35120 [Asparagus officinalis]|uniref:YdbS-like PH domain-containing protein n=1 Tax=Asparagus officinalis TaxID=4686 RepID=A0A5P1EKX7_ASPOF|nr:uncharacterized protein A4U43_C07F35120 [Asparagus officinalis]